MAEKTKKGLGKGMGALFGEETAKLTEKEVLTLPITKVEPRQDQPRSQFDQEALDELAASIGTYGVIQPISVRRLENGYYQIIAGERRWRAARQAGLKEVPVRVLEADDKRAMELALVENLQREDLNPIEEARGFRSLMDEYGLTQEAAAESVGKSRPAVANALRLLSLSGPVLELVENGELSAGHARALLPVSNAETQLQAAQSVISGGLSVRQTEALAARLVREAKKAGEETEAVESGVVVDYAAQVGRSLEQALGRKVKITDGRRRGRIELEFYGADDREALISSLLTLGQNKE